MKTNLLLTTLLLLANLSYSQDTIYYSNNNSKPLESGQIPYIIGSHVISGYEIEIRTCADDENVTLPNGRKVAGLSCIILDKYNYIGGKLIYGKNKTIITDILITPIGDSAVFTVFGKKFNMNFILLEGTILELEDDHAVFNTEGKGIWSIVKK